MCVLVYGSVLVYDTTYIFYVYMYTVFTVFTIHIPSYFSDATTALLIVFLLFVIPSEVCCCSSELTNCSLSSTMIIIL